MSPEAIDSAWVELERLVTTYVAVSEREDRLMPLYRRDCEIPALLRPLAYIDFRDDSKFEENYQKLLTIIRDEPLPRGERHSPDEPASVLPDIPRPPAVGFVARRDRDGRNIVERLREELAPGKDQLVVLWGAGGVGKTTLAAEAARALAGDFAGRVVWVSAEARTDLPFTMLLDEIARQLGDEDLRRLAPEQKAEAVSLLIAVAPTLIVLDNFETISPTEEELCKEFLSQRAHCSALITTRQRVEQARSVPIDAMSREEADDFLRRLIEQSPDRDIYAELDLGRIIQTAEANPLIIEWIVGQIDLANDPEEVLNDLAQGEGDAAHRVFDRSFNLPQLNNGGRAVLLALSMFVPSASRPMLAAVANLALGKKRERERFKKAYETLASLWLIKKTDAGQRLAVAGLTRELTKARLSRAPRALTYRQRFVARFLHYSEANSQSTAENLNAVDTEKNNILNAVNVAFEVKNWESMLRIRHAMDDFLRVRGYWDEAIRSGEQALAVARNLSDKRWVAVFTHNIALISQYRGDVSKARKLYGESLEIAKRFNDQMGIATAFHHLGLLAQAIGEFGEARRLYNESLEILKRLNDQSKLAASIHQLGTISFVEGRLEEAENLYGESLAILRRVEHKEFIAECLESIGNLSVARNSYAGARELFAEAFQLAEVVKDKFRIANIKRSLGLLAEKEGDRERAVELLREASGIFKELGSPEAEKMRHDLERLEGECS